MTKLQITELGNLQPIELIQIHSLDWMIYQVTVSQGEKRQLLYDGQAPCKFYNLIQIKELFETLDVKHYQLVRDNSAYDEMVGQPETLFSDTIACELFWKQVNNIQH